MSVTSACAVCILLSSLLMNKQTHAKPLQLLSSLPRIRVCIKFEGPFTSLPLHEAEISPRNVTESQIPCLKSIKEMDSHFHFFFFTIAYFHPFKTMLKYLQRIIYYVLPYGKHTDELAWMRLLKCPVTSRTDKAGTKLMPGDEG